MNRDTMVFLFLIVALGVIGVTCEASEIDPSVMRACAETCGRRGVERVEKKSCVCGPPVAVSAPVDGGLW